MNKINHFILFLSFIVILFSCTSKSSEKKQATLDSLKKDSIAKVKFFSKYNRFYNDMARLLAGLEQEKGSSLSGFDKMQVCIDYRKSSNEFFSKMKSGNLAKMVEFRKNELENITKDSMNVFYPFSGPDFANMDAFFPNARNTVMFGLEPVGNIPDIKGATEKELSALFKALRTSIDSLAPLGYFMTLEMGRDFHRVSELNGTLPIIALFMVQWDYRILNVKRFTIDKEGKMVDSLPGKKDKNKTKDNFISGGLIEYVKNGETRVRTLYYFSHDVSDESLKRTPEFITFLSSIRYDVAFFKAASYLCFWMKTIRSVILDNSNCVVQDDSGIPIKFFNNSDWNVKYYGKYQRILKVFEKPYFQKDLKEIYDTSKTIKPLNFAFGYGIRINQCNLIVAKKN